ncbi:MAG: hypothetical protein ACREOZ_04125 [Gloeomargaritales cyanobacterium]
MGGKETVMDIKERVKRRSSEEKRRWIMRDESSRWDNRKVEGLNKRGRKTVKRQVEGWGGRRTSIARETLLPTEPPMGALCSGGKR